MSGFNIVLNLDKAVKFSKPFWSKVGQWIVNKIRADAGQGVFQTDDPWKKTYSPEYAELKENKMSQITGYTKKGKAKRTRLEPYKGVSITSTNTSFVDMTLTGQTLRGLKVRVVTENGTTLAFELRDADKIIGNQRPHLNRRLVGLNKKNRTKVRDMVIDEMKRQVKKQLLGKQTINFNI